MAENDKQNKSSKNIGDLYVDIEAKGLQALLKGLNKVSSSFFIAKTAAEKFLRPISEMQKNAGQTGVEVGKMSAMLGASVADVQRLTNYFKEKNMDTSLIADITKMQSTIYDLLHGYSGLDGNMNIALSNMGIDIWKYNDSLESTLQLFEDIQKATKNMPAVDRQAQLRLMGISQEYGYLFERGEFSKSDVLRLSDAEIQKLQAAAEATAKLNIETEQLKNKFSAKISPLTTNVAKQPIEIFEGLEKGDKNAKIKAVGVAGSTVLGALTGAATIGVAGAGVGSAVPGVGTAVGGVGGVLYGLWQGGKMGYNTGIKALGAGETLKEHLQGQSTGFAAPIVPPAMQEYPQIPTDIINNNSSITNNNSFNITGQNAEEIGKEIKHQLDLQSLEYNQFQLYNPPRK